MTDPAMQLIDAYLDGELTPELEAELVEWLAADRANVREFVRCTFDDRTIRDIAVGDGLREELKEEADRVAAESTREISSPRRRLRRGTIVRWTRRAIALTAAAIVVVAAALWWPRRAEYPAMAASGDYRIVGGGALRRGALVRAGAGAAELALGDYCRVGLDAGSEVRIEGGELAEAVRLERGSVTCEVESGRGSFEVATGAGRACVAGTKFTVRLLEERSAAGASVERMQVVVTEGDVVLSGEWGEWQIAAGESKVIGGRPVGMVSNIKVLSDKVEDVSTVEAWRKSFIKPGMSEKEKAFAVWRSVVGFHHQQNPPREFVQNERAVHDPIKTFNVYGYGMCSCNASNITALARAAGIEARGWGLKGHSVAEIKWDGKWHLLDGSLINYFENARGEIASVQEIIDDIRRWYDANPGYEGNEQRLRRFMRGWGWKKGPPVVATGKHYDRNGWMPAATHGWYSTMAEFDGSTAFNYEYGYSMGYRALFRLRRGESLVRNWSSKGLHVNMDHGEPPSCIGETVGEGSLRYTPRFGDIAPGRIGNGSLVYRVPLAGKRWRSGAHSLENVAIGRGIVPERPGKVAEAIFRMHSPYVFLGGKVKLSGRAAAGSSLRMLLSTNNGRDWTETWRLAGDGDFTEAVALGARVLRRYDYHVKLELDGDIRVDGLELENDIQHSQRALPALAQGENTVTVSAGPATDTVTVEPSVVPVAEGRNEGLQSLGVVTEGVRRDGGGLWCQSFRKPGLVTIPVETPGDMVSVRFGGHFRARDPKDGVSLLLSFDKGTSWTEVGKVRGPYAGFCRYFEFNEVPEGTRKVLVRYELTQAKNTAGIMGLRIDADYWDTPDGRPPRGELCHPVKITYLWEELGRAKRHVHVSENPNETYTINCESKPLMRSIVVELAD